MQSIQKKDTFITNKFLSILICFAIIFNATGFFSLVCQGNPSVFSIIAKNIVLSHNWINLTFANQAWLDKPHFPFWVTALSFKLFGINAFAYILPGFLFCLIGAYYTYLLAKKLYSHEVGLLSALIYLSSLHLMLCTINVVAEPYLLGEIMPACYYWLCYDENNSHSIKISFLLKGAFFTALAMMTKGIFVLVTIVSGLVVVSLYHSGFYKTLRKFFTLKWLLGLFLALVFIAPEIISLYLQFDKHPDLIVYGHTHVSGIKFYFWDSQFGRFMNNGPISRNIAHFDFSHYYYYVLVMLWAFLPWSVLFFVALFSIKRWWHLLKDKSTAVYLLGSFFPTFIMFSLTQFQSDRYTNIIFPFAAIILANYIYLAKHMKSFYNLIVNIRYCVSGFIGCFVLTLSLKLLHAWPTTDIINGSNILIHQWIFIIIVALSIATLFFLILTFKNKRLYLAITASLVSFILVINFLHDFDNVTYKIYQRGYIVGHYLEDKPKHTVIDYRNGWSNNLQFNTQNNYSISNSFNDLIKKMPQPTAYYLIFNKKELKDVISNLALTYRKNKAPLPKITILREFSYINVGSIEDTLSIFLNHNKQAGLRDHVLIALVSWNRETKPQ